VIVANLNDIDLASTDLSPQAVLMLTDLMSRRLKYIEAGRSAVAHGMGMAIVIAWRHSLMRQIDIELPDTLVGDL
jgi:hypothetical protein